MVAWAHIIFFILDWHITVYVPQCVTVCFSVFCEKDSAILASGSVRWRTLFCSEANRFLNPYTIKVVEAVLLIVEMRLRSMRGATNAA